MNLKKTMVLAALLVSAALASAVNPRPFTVPEIQQWKGGEGVFVPTTNTRIVTDGKDARVAEIANIYSQDYAALTGSTLAVTNGKAQKGDIVLKIKKNKKANNESYSIKITANGVTVTAPSEQGLYWATRTLLQLTEMASDGLSLPVGEITDAPQYAIRGFMIDAGRKFIPMDYLYDLVNTMSYYKMNTLQVHLNDNGFPRFYDNDWSKTQAAFRMESDKFPGLTARDGSYTKEEFRNFANYAATKGVEIIPEIDVPAHALAFTHYKPELACKVHNDVDHLDIENPATYEFIDTLFAEYIGGENPVFPGPIFHIGTDEYKGDSITMEKFRAFTDRYIKYTESFGKKPAVWGSLSHAKGKTPVQVDNVLMYGWSNDYSNPKEMLALGYQMVSIPDGYVYIVPEAGYYYNYLNTDLIYNHWSPRNIGGYIVPDENLHQVSGGMFAVWNDTPNNGLTVKDVAHRVMHALPSMAAKTWSDKVTVPYDEFIAKSSKMIEAPGVNYLARYGNADEPTEILKMNVVPAGTTLPIPEIGYDYTVEFDIEGAAEEKGTKLFESPNAVVWLSDPITGRFAFSREEDMFTFRQNILPGEKLHVKITGNNKGTKLYVNGKLIDDMNIRWRSYFVRNQKGELQPTSGYKLAQVRTLVFPLQKAGNFNSKVTNLRVVNAIID